MLKKIKYFLMVFFLSTNVNAGVADFEQYFTVDMFVKLPDIKEYLQKILSENKLYDKGYVSRFEMGNRFKKEFSKTIKFYGLSEGRIKNSYEDDLIEVLSWLPKDVYQYIGPMLHEVPGMSEKILNMPGIKETKNQFPQRVANKMKEIENIEYMSPALYFLLMPEIWGEVAPQETIVVKEKTVKKYRAKIELPDFLKEKIGVPVNKPQKVSKKENKKPQYTLNLRTLNPTLTSPLTTADAKAFVGTIDEIIEWGDANNMAVYSKVITGEHLLNMWEIEQNTALLQNGLKDLVNPCQRLILKLRFAGLYDEFKLMLSKHGYTPEEWAYTGDKTIRAFRALNATQGVAYAVRYHREGYYDTYIDRLPKKWKDEMYASQTAIIKMYAVLKEDIEAVKPLKKEINDKFVKSSGVILTMPIMY